MKRERARHLRLNRETLHGLDAGHLGAVLRVAGGSTNDSAAGADHCCTIATAPAQANSGYYCRTANGDCECSTGQG